MENITIKDLKALGIKLGIIIKSKKKPEIIKEIRNSKNYEKYKEEQEKLKQKRNVEFLKFKKHQLSQEKLQKDQLKKLQELKSEKLLLEEKLFEEAYEARKLMAKKIPKTTSKKSSKSPHKGNRKFKNDTKYENLYPHGTKIKVVGVSIYKGYTGTIDHYNPINKYATVILDAVGGAAKRIHVTRLNKI